MFPSLLDNSTDLFTELLSDNCFVFINAGEAPQEMLEFPINTM